MRRVYYGVDTLLETPAPHGKRHVSEDQNCPICGFMDKIFLQLQQHTNGRPHIEHAIHLTRVNDKS